MRFSEYVLATQKMRRLLGDDFAPFAEKLVKVQFSNGDNLESLYVAGNHGHKVYSKRYGIRGRILCIPINVDEIPCWWLIDVLPNHDYHKSKYTKRGKLAESLANPAIVAELREHYLEQLTAASKPHEAKLDTSTRALRMRLSSSGDDKAEVVVEALQSYNGKYLSLTAKQRKAANQSEYPFVSTGSAGTGKSIVALTHLENCVERDAMITASSLSTTTEGKLPVDETKQSSLKYLYIVASKSLATAVKKSYVAENAGSQITISSYADFAIWVDPTLKNKTEVAGSYAIKWLASQSKLPLVFRELLTTPEGASRVYEEWRVLSGIALEHYYELSDRDTPTFHVSSATFSKGRTKSLSKDSTLPETKTLDRSERRLFIANWLNAYKQHLAENDLYDLAFYELPDIAEELKPRHICLDEGQDISTLQYRNLLKVVSLDDAGKPRLAIFMDTFQRIQYSCYPLLHLLKHCFGIRNITELTGGFRCSQMVTGLTQLISKMNRFASRGVIEQAPYLSITNTHNSTRGFVVLMDNNVTKQSEEMRARLTRMTENASCAVITIPSLVVEAENIFPNTVVFTVEQAKGLEFDYVILYKFLQRTEHVAINESLKDFDVTFEDKFVHRAKAGQADYRHVATLNQAENAISRTRIGVVIYGNTDLTSRENYAIRHFVKPIFDYTERSNLTLASTFSIAHVTGETAPLQAIETKLPEISISTRQDWINCIHDYLANGNREQAFKIARIRLRLSRKEFDKRYPVQSDASSEIDCAFTEIADVATLSDTDYEKQLNSFLCTDNFSFELFQKEIGNTKKTFFENLFNDFIANKNERLICLLKLLQLPEFIFKIRPQDLYTLPSFQTEPCIPPLHALLGVQQGVSLITSLLSVFSKNSTLRHKSSRELGQLVINLLNHSSNFSHEFSENGFLLINCLLNESHLTTLGSKTRFDLCKQLVTYFKQLSLPLQEKYLRQLSSNVINFPKLFDSLCVSYGKTTLLLEIACSNFLDGKAIDAFANDDFITALCKPVTPSYLVDEKVQHSKPSSLYQMLTAVHATESQSYFGILTALINLKPALFSNESFSAALFEPVGTSTARKKYTPWFWLSLRLDLHPVCHKLIDANPSLFKSDEFKQVFLNQYHQHPSCEDILLTTAYLLSKSKYGILFYHKLIKLNPSLFTSDDFISIFLHSDSRLSSLLYHFSETEMGLLFINSLITVCPRAFRTLEFMEGLARLFNSQEKTKMSGENLFQHWSKIRPLGMKLIEALLPHVHVSYREAFLDVINSGRLPIIDAAESKPQPLSESASALDTKTIPLMRKFLNRKNFSFELFQQPYEHNCTMFETIFCAYEKNLSKTFLLMLNLLKTPEYLNQISLQDIYTIPQIEGIQTLDSPLTLLASTKTGIDFINTLSLHFEVTTDLEVFDPDPKSVPDAVIKEPSLAQDYFIHMVKVIDTSLAMTGFLIARNLLIQYAQKTCISEIIKTSLQIKMLTCFKRLSTKDRHDYFFDLSQILMLYPSFGRLLAKRKVHDLVGPLSLPDVPGCISSVGSISLQHGLFAPSVARIKQEITYDISHCSEVRL